MLQYYKHWASLARCTAISSVLWNHLLAVLLEDRKPRRDAQEDLASWSRESSVVEKRASILLFWTAPETLSQGVYPNVKLQINQSMVGTVALLSPHLNQSASCVSLNLLNDRRLSRSLKARVGFLEVHTQNITSMVPLSSVLQSVLTAEV